MQVIASVFPVLLMDRLGRRPLLIMAALGECAACISVGLYFYLRQQWHFQGLSWMAICSVAVFIVAFSIGWGPVPWVIISEIFPLKTRGLACGICTVAKWVFAFLVTLVFPTLQTAMTPYGVFWMFAGICLFSALYVTVFVIETKGKSLEEIEAHYRVMDTTSTH